MNSIKVLYAEDEISIIAFVKILFKKYNFKNVVYAKNGKEALELYKENDFDIVITDMIMPVMNGFELIAEIRKINPSQIFVMATGLHHKEDFIKAIELRVNFFIKKPINPKKFSQVLKDSITIVNQKKELLLSNTLLNQYKHAIDSNTILSKVDIKGNITYVNEEFCRVYKYRQEDIIGKESSILIHPNMSSSILNDMQKSISLQRQWSGVVKNISKDAKEYILDTQITPLFDINNNLLEFIIIRHDITELEEYKDDLQKQLSIAVQDVIDTQREVVFTMGAIGETRSKETGFHVKRVAEYSYILALLVGLSQKDAELLKLASPMHDIGKVGIPDSILNKPGKHTYEEFEIMKTHASLGYEMLKGSKRKILKTSAIVAYEHHERWDGKGYPRGLKGDNIDINGRITSICDVFDALGSDRCYKKAWKLEKIIELFIEEKGYQFDPQLVELFLDNLDKFLLIRDKYKD